MISIEGENMHTKFNVLSYRIDYKLKIEIDANGHIEKNIDLEIKKTKSSRTRTWLWVC